MNEESDRMVHKGCGAKVNEHDPGDYACVVHGGVVRDDVEWPLWRAFAASCGECGRERSPLPEKAELWLCSECETMYREEGLWGYK